MISLMSWNRTNLVLLLRTLPRGASLDVRTGAAGGAGFLGGHKGKTVLGGYGTRCFARSKLEENKVFVDKSRIACRGGKGGNGCVSFQRDKKNPFGGPDGADGGDGGTVYVQACSSTLDLARDKFHYAAEFGSAGLSRNKVGKHGADTVILVPVGTVVKILETPGEETQVRTNGPRCSIDEVIPTKISAIQQENAGKKSGPAEKSQKVYTFTEPGKRGEQKLTGKLAMKRKKKDEKLARKQQKARAQAGIIAADEEDEDEDEVQTERVDDDVDEGEEEEEEEGKDNVRYLRGGRSRRGGNEEEEEDKEEREDNVRNRNLRGARSRRGRRGDKEEEEEEMEEEWEGEGQPERRRGGFWVDENTSVYEALARLTGVEYIPGEEERNDDSEEVYRVLADLDRDGQRVAVARGGLGGRGNMAFARKDNRAPRVAEEGSAGDSVRIELELKTLADVGLIGFPNAGKSSLLGVISKAKPKVASYPFTTLRPYVGIVEVDEHEQYTVADVPGLIEGAHANVGLGHTFLRHIERAKTLVYVLDAAGQDGRRPWSDLQVLKNELEFYMPGLSRRAGLILLNKTDLPEAEANIGDLKWRLEDLYDREGHTHLTRLPLLEFSCRTKKGIAEVIQAMYNVVAERRNAPIDKFTGQEIPTYFTR